MTESGTDGKIEASLTGFNFTSDGWQRDKQGNTVLRVAGDARVTIPYKLFGTDVISVIRTEKLQRQIQMTRNVTLTPQFRTDQEFTVTFKDYDGTVLDTQIKWSILKRSTLIWPPPKRSPLKRF